MRAAPYPGIAICFQPRQGYGKQLLDYSMEKAKEMGAGALAITGNIDFYGKSGFVPAKTKGVRYADDPEADYFLIKELTPGFLDGISGTYKDPEGYFVCEKAAGTAVLSRRNLSMIESRCGLRCSDCNFRESMGCKGCVNMDKPFWADSCPVKSCCEKKGLQHCGECDGFVCPLLHTFAYDMEQSDNGARIEQCQKWCNNNGIQ